MMMLEVNTIRRTIGNKQHQAWYSNQVSQDTLDWTVNEGTELCCVPRTLSTLDPVYRMPIATHFTFPSALSGSGQTTIHSAKGKNTLRYSKIQ